MKLDGGSREIGVASRGESSPAGDHAMCQVRCQAMISNSTGSIYKAKPRAHMWACLCVCAQVCVWREGPDRWAVYTCRPQKPLIPVCPSRQQCLSTRILDPVTIQGLSWEEGWSDHSRAPA